MDIQLGSFSLIMQGITGAFVFLLPVVMWIVWRRKSKAAWLPLLAGIGGYLIIGLVRGVARLLFLSGLQGSPWAFYIMQAVFAGVFEEAGRYLVFSYAIPNNTYIRDGISYGIGHGGLEHIIVSGLGNDVDGFLISNCIAGLIYKTQGMAPFLADGLTAEETQEYVQRIAETGMGTCFIIIIGAFSSMILHISMSALVFITVHYSNDKKWLLTAVVIHTIADIIGAFSLAGTMSKAETGIISLLFSCAAAYAAYRVWENNRPALKQPESADRFFE